VVSMTEKKSFSQRIFFLVCVAYTALELCRSVAL
jgi:hypothetical protein